MKFIQLNTNHCAAAHDLLVQTICEWEIDVAIVSEQYKNLDKNVWEKDLSGRAAIWASGKMAIEEGMKVPQDSFTRAKIGGIYVYSCYVSPNVSLLEFGRVIENLVHDANQHKPTIIAGDFNAAAVEWGCNSTNNRGRLLLEAFSLLDVVLLNRGNAQTFRRGGFGSIVDITFISPSLASDVKWKVSEHYTHSDHQAILFSINMKKPMIEKGERAFCQGWASDKLDPDTFAETFLTQHFEDGPVNNMAERLVKSIKTACDASMPRRRRAGNNKRKENYWWNEEIAVLRKTCLHARRRYQRGRSRDDFEERVRAYHLARNDLQKAIKKSKKHSFEKLCKEADSDPWGGAYRIVMSRLKGKKSAQVTCPVLISRIVASLFPQREQYTGDLSSRNRSNPEPVSEEEILRLCSKIGDKKAPGPDCIPNRALKTAIKSAPHWFAKLFNECLGNGVFPNMWKKQKLILIPKPGKTLGEPGSYRPICLLDTIGKCLERIIYSRIQKVIEETDGISQMQFGFRKAKSTVDAIKLVVETAKKAIEGKGIRRKYCAIVTLDIKNAFNSAGWDHIIRSLRRLNIPEYLIRIVNDYFSDRTLWYETDNGTVSTNITAGVPQGSVLGPILWNAMYDGLFKLKVPKEAKIVGFADDVAVIVQAGNIEEVQIYANETIRTIKMWLESLELQLAEQKTEAVLISSKRSKEVLKLKIGRSEIASTDAIKYLGVIIDSRLNFKRHTDYSCQKASKVVSALARMMPNVGGPRHSRRLLLSRVANSILLYGAPIWECALRCTSRKDMMSIFRRSCLRVCSGYRTISFDAACVIAGIIPIDIAAREFSKIYVERQQNHHIQPKIIRQTERQRSILNWQRRWDHSMNGRWTHRLIPNVERWINRKHGEICYHLTQFLTGHGGYRSYLYRCGHDDSARCPTCSDQDETVEHVIFKCHRFDEERRSLELQVGCNLSPENIVEVMMESEEKWNSITSFITLVNESLRREEQLRNDLRAINHSQQGQ